MRVNPICASVYPMNAKKSKQKKGIQVQQTTNSQTFKGGLKLPDYIAGGICGTAFGIVVGTALCPPIGIVAGLISAKATAEANRDSRPLDDDDD